MFGRREPAPSLVEVSTYGADTAYDGIGSGPNEGDGGGGFLQTLSTPTTTPHLRQWFRLCAFPIPAFHRCRLVRVGQYAEIGQSYPQEGGGNYPLIFPVTSANWKFTDGNIAWCIRVCPYVQAEFISDIATPMRSDPNVYNTTPALLYVPDPAGGFGGRYVPPMNAIPPGQGVGKLHLWKTLDYRWQDKISSLDFAIDGPALVIMSALLWQTDPATRGPHVLPGGGAYDLGGILPEDRFLQANGSAIYTRVGGSMTYEMYPDQPAARVLGGPGMRSVLQELGALITRLGREGARL